MIGLGCTCVWALRRLDHRFLLHHFHVGQIFDQIQETVIRYELVESIFTFWTLIGGKVFDAFVAKTAASAWHQAIGFIWGDIVCIFTNRTRVLIGKRGAKDGRFSVTFHTFHSGDETKKTWGQFYCSIFYIIYKV